MKPHTNDWVFLANAALSARNRLRSEGLTTIDAILRQTLDPTVRQQVEQARRVIADCANELRLALKARRKS